MQLHRQRPIKSLVMAIPFLLLFLSGSLLAAGGGPQLIRLATTTSTDNSGLLEHLLPAFQKESGYQVHVIAVGTGKALRMGRDGDVDVVLVHAPKSERAFVDSGYGEQRYSVMYNDFVIVGPNSNPAGIGSAEGIDGAMRAIEGSASLFISRGDDSGTHKKELGLWQGAGVTPKGNWYREAGQGMGKVLQMAGELDAYTLTDRGTWLAYRNRSPLGIAFEGDDRLFNPYSIIAVNPRLHPHSNHDGATALIKWITSNQGQKLIGSFRIAKTQLFKPSADAQQVAQLNTKSDGNAE